MNSNQHIDTSTNQSMYIAGIGMITAVGGNAEMTSAAVRAGISAYQLSDYTDRQNKAITMVNIPKEVFSSMNIDIDKGDEYKEQHDHIIKMAILALQDAFAHIQSDTDAVKQTIPLILAMPEPQPLSADKPMAAKRLIKNIIKLSGLPIAAEQIRCIHTGRAAGLQALDLAQRYLFEQGNDYVIVGGSDSYCTMSLINQLESQQRLLTESNKDGFAPGEAASFIVLTRHAQYAQNKNNQIVKLHPVGLDEEGGHLSSDAAYRGDGLDQAFKKALLHYNGSSISKIYSSMNGESFWSKEQGVAIIRNKKHFCDDMTVEHPADCYGDPATATGTLLMGLSALALLEEKAEQKVEKKTEQQGVHLVYSSSDGPTRAAVVLEKIACRVSPPSVKC